MLCLEQKFTNLTAVIGFHLQVVSGPHKGETLRLPAGGADVRVGRNAPRKNGLRLDSDFEVSDK